MPKFVITEIWTRSRVVNAQNEAQALRRGEPDAHPFRFKVGNPSQLLDEIHEKGVAEVAACTLGLNLSNWHATRVE